ncbi:ATP-grasp domain [Rubrobacter radiotolerans]|uniref:ATP-grasp domain n=1 Tax=Rubrobacter radiotolerans TaxID=42256 RepID=A0A023X0U7_RUBRA|nr:bifunctional acetate--CoA ligase family protein/GNAT family N-acetyltransferase [Rubrobacter radiotolerans]AHY45689.1 ATP-grasp domain [Rubrobacter radiotolerans]MDX5893103.1 bifunctional acetate--CoA ligase family protein/GNAT family N-acetyltransferase [Rubrobacter radiotolerans]SMC03063.1 acetyltransferase [Rubrobacter radiotolerans DSM 5868]
MVSRKKKPTNSDPAHDVLGYDRQQLDAIFKPENVAVIGATERPGSVGRTIMWNLVSNPFGGTVFPVNPKRPNVLGIKTYPSIGEVPAEVDLAIVVSPAPSVPGIIRECVEAGVLGAIIISAGFKETGEEGARLEEETLREARKGRMRIIGPNCLGVMNPLGGLNATFAGSMARPGNVAFLSQSGALLTAILDRSFQENVGFSNIVSVGSMMDVDWGDLIYYLGDDPKTHAIVVYMESIGDPSSFLSAAREVALTKPIIVIKPGRTEAASEAAASHTGALTGSDEVLDAAFRRSGVLRVDTISELFNMAEVLGKQPRPKGPRLTVVTNAGGPGVLATDALITGGGELTEISPEAMEELNAILPGPWSHGNPIDILGDADPERYAKTLEKAAEDENSDGLLVILTPQDMTDPTETANALVPYARSTKKPVLASWMGGQEVAGGVSILNGAGIPTFDYPDTAAQAFNNMWRYTYNLRGIYETPELAEDEAVDRERAREVIEAARESGRTLLTEYESKELLAAYGIPTVETRVATTEDEAVRAAEEIGYPVVLKIHSETITHKTDVGGVRLNLPDEAAVREAFSTMKSRVTSEFAESDFLGVTVQPMEKLDGYETILGSSMDPQFGPVLLFGSGGSLVEVYRDRALALPPLTTTLARRMMERTRIYEAFAGVRGRGPVDRKELARLLVRFSQLVVEQPWVAELDINPLLISEDRFLALDARVVIHDPETPEQQLPKPAIRPYPNQYVTKGETNEGEEFTVRPIRPEDEPLMVKFHESLSEQSVYMRYFHMMRLDQRTAHERLTRICFIDYDREMALVAERVNPETGEREIMGVGRLSRHGFVPGEAEFSVLIADPFQRKGLGTLLLERLLEVGRAEGLSRITAEILMDNRPMQKISRNCGFTLHRDLEEMVVKAELDLRQPQAV